MRRQDKRELREDRRALRDDARDLDRMEALLERFDRARSARDARALFGVDEALERELASERAETQVELARGDAEVRRDRHELSSERREVAGDRRRGDVGEAARDRRR